ncbi:phosphatase PAP2 family protein [Lysobacter sp. CAU 1642]|uniref:undecaprenyl-diphosphate phosphatase n=2 Tax=Pseudomarimonas salicorniae TaxID=2933270 RepID=A0ABT0GDH2_9GAMM|nr:phosphatase PAP2 family protein [Lysobacter sp. CAU 1642]MCK7592595.1 phosphatase PAP2 family protein [Lysobacter sp. CAU 1642]
MPTRALIFDGVKRRELAWCLAANRWARGGSAGRVFTWISRAGDGPIWYALMLAVVMLDGWNGLSASVHMAATGLVALILYTQLKRRTRRPRPFRDDARIKAITPPLDEFSFPSGHTLHAVSFTIIAVAWYPALALILVPFTVAVAASRVILGLHYPSDVAAAALIASVLGLGSLILAA